jgi:hypothetical protein
MIGRGFVPPVVANETEGIGFVLDKENSMSVKVKSAATQAGYSITGCT